MSVTVPGGTITVDTKLVGSAQQQRVVAVPGAGGASTANRTVLTASSTAPFAALASNTGRVGARIRNDLTSTIVLYVLEGSDTPSSSNYDANLNPGDIYESTNGYTGAIQAAWSASSGGTGLSVEYIE